MNKRRKMKKNVLLGGMMTLAAMLSVMNMGGCGCESTRINSSAETTSAATADSATTPSYSAEEQAVLEEHLSVDASGNITDSSGKQVTLDENGKAVVKKADGTVVKVDADTVKKALEKQASEQKTNSDTPVNPAQSQQESHTAVPKATESKQPAVKPSESPATVPAEKEKSQPATVDPHAGKTYHEDEYEYIKHPAQKEQIKIVDREAYSYEEPVYEEKWSMICWGCGADVGDDNMTMEEREEHMLRHVLNGEPDGFHSGYTTVQTGTKTVYVPEESHFETRVIKEEWTEKKLIRKAGWY